MPGDGQGRRFLIATAIAHYSRAPQWDRPGLLDARNAIIDLFTGLLGYQHVSDLGLNPTRDQLTTQLRAFCRSAERRPDDMVAVYIAGHGEVLDGSQDHVLLTSDTDPDDIADALPTVELARKMLLDTPVRRVLLMLDACYSGRGGHDLVAAALTRMTEHWGQSQGSGLVVITSAQPAEQAQTGAFPRLLREAVEGWPTAGYTPSVLALDAVVKAMNGSPSKPGFQTIGSTLAHLTGEVPPFLPNPRHDPRMTEVDLAIQQATEWETQAERRDIEYRTRLLVRAMGGHGAAQGWWFSGRRAALIDITSWLTHPDPARPLLAVTAAPGSGKTAVLGLIATLTHPERRVTVPLHGLGLPSAAIPAPGTVDVVIYAQNLTTDQVFHGITAAAHVHAEKVGELLDQLTGRVAPLTVLVDALDEAADPDQLTRRLLRPLAEHAEGRLRLLVGTRPHLLDNLGLRREDSIDLDAPRYADLDALITYAARGLLDAVPHSPYQQQPPTTIRAIARAVAEASDPSFLVARITSSTLAADPAIPDPHDPAWRRTLPRLPGDAMRRDLETRLGAQAKKVRDLLRPLAFAEGQGLPWEDIWAPLASHIAGVDYTDDDLLWLRHHAGSYVVEATEANRSAYRLYHQALAEHLRDDTEDTAIHHAFTQVLRSRVPLNLDGSRDWTRAHPYALRHLATHAAHCGLLDELITDTDYLVYAEPDELLIALHRVATDESQLTGAIYRASAAVHRHLSPLRRRQVLATDAARFAATHHHRALAEPLHWPPRWATGQQTNSALHTTLTGHDGSVSAVACTTLGGQPVAVTAGDDATVWVWDLITATLRVTLTGHDGRVNAVACSTVDGQPVAVTASYDETVRVWDLITATLRATLTGHDGWVSAVACSTVDGQSVAVTAGDDETVRVWDLTTATLRATLTGHVDRVSAVACSTVDGQSVAVTAGDDATVRVWDLTTATLRATLTGHDGWVSAVACSTVDGQPVTVTAGNDPTVRVWHLANAVGKHITAGHTANITAVACSIVDGQPVAVTASNDGTVRVWDLTTATLRVTLTGHDGRVNAVACSTVDGQPVAVTASADHTVRVWDLTTATLRVTLTGHHSWVNAVACTTVDGQPVAVTASAEQTVRVWDLTTATLRAALTGHDGSVSAVACTTVDGQPVAVSAGDKTVWVWDLTTATLRAALTGHDGSVRAVACTTVDGQPVAVTASYDKTVRVWDLTTTTELAIFDYAGYVRGALCIGPAQEIVIGTGWDLVVLDRRPSR
jgi:WD40 repeat protein